MSFFSFFIIDVVLCHVLLDWFFTIFWMSDLKSSHSVCGFVSSWFVSLCFKMFIFSWTRIPLFIIFSIRFMSLSALSGQVQQPFPISGASFGANLTDTIQWSIGVAVVPASHSNRVGACLLAAYILSSLECVQPFSCGAWCVKHLWLGYMWRHWSCISQLCFISLRDSRAAQLSSLGGALSMRSFIMLKSPSIKSRHGMQA